MAQECMRMAMRCVMQCPRVCQTKQCRCSKKNKWCSNVVFEHMHGSGSAETQTNFCLINIFYLILLHVPPFCSDSGWMVKLHPQEVGMLKSSNLQTHLPPKRHGNHYCCHILLPWDDWSTRVNELSNMLAKRPISTIALFTNKLDQTGGRQTRFHMNVVNSFALGKHYENILENVAKKIS